MGEGRGPEGSFCADQQQMALRPTWGEWYTLKASWLLSAAERALGALGAQRGGLAGVSNLGMGPSVQS